MSLAREESSVALGRTGVLTVIGWAGITAEVREMATEDPSTNGSSRDPATRPESGSSTAQLGVTQAVFQELLAELKAMRRDLGAVRSIREEPSQAAPKPVPVLGRPTEEHRERLLEIGRDYVERPNSAQDRDITLAQVTAATRALARAAAITDVCAEHGFELWPAAQATIVVAGNHYATFQGVADRFGVTDALSSDDYYVLRHLDMGSIPDEDLEILKMAGVGDPAAYLRAMVRRAHATADRLSRPGLIARDPTKDPLAGVLADAHAILGRFAEGDKAHKAGPPPLPKKRKIWTGIGKILKGAAVASGNLIPVAAAVGIFTVNPAAGAAIGAGAVTSWDKILSSCGAGVGDICEGVGAIRDEG